MTNKLQNSLEVKIFFHFVAIQIKNLTVRFFLTNWIGENQTAKTIYIGF